MLSANDDAQCRRRCSVPATRDNVVERAGLADVERTGPADCEDLADGEGLTDGEGLAGD